VAIARQETVGLSCTDHGNVFLNELIPVDAEWSAGYADARTASLHLRNDSELKAQVEGHAGMSEYGAGVACLALQGEREQL
jgi:hypothetical protein